MPSQLRSWDDVESFRELVRRTVATQVGVTHTQDLEDLVQEVLIHLGKVAERGCWNPDKGAADGYVAVIARRWAEVLRSYRREVRWRDTMRASEDLTLSNGTNAADRLVSDETPLSALLAEERIWCMRTALSRLRRTCPKTVELLTAYYFEEMSCREIAARTGARWKLCSNRIGKARRRLRSLLEVEM